MPSISIYTVYKNPIDYPGKYVVREFKIVQGTAGPLASREPLIVADSYEDIKKRMQRMQLVCVARHPEDEPQIMESWM